MQGFNRKRFARTHLTFFALVFGIAVVAFSGLLLSGARAGDGEAHQEPTAAQVAPGSMAQLDRTDQIAQRGQKTVVDSATVMPPAVDRADQIQGLREHSGSATRAPAVDRADMIEQRGAGGD